MSSPFTRLRGALGRLRPRRPAGQTTRRARLVMEALEERQALTTMQGMGMMMMPMPMTGGMMSMMPMPVAGAMMHHGHHHAVHHAGHHRM
jgi:hypothetical protein